MTTASWGCEVCRAEIRAIKFNRIALMGEAKTTFLRIYQCQDCRQWYVLDISERLYYREPGRARELLARIAAGY